VPEQEQQRVAVGPGNAQFMSIRQVSLRRGTYCRPLPEHNFRVFAQPRNFCLEAQLWQISGFFGANNLPFLGNLGANWTSENP